MNQEAPRVKDEELAALLPFDNLADRVQPPTRLSYRAPGLSQVFIESKFGRASKTSAQSDKVGVYAFAKPNSKTAAVVSWSFVLMAAVRAARTSVQFRVDLLELLNAPGDGSQDREIMQRFIDRAHVEVQAARGKTP